MNNQIKLDAILILTVYSINNSYLAGEKMEIFKYKYDDLFNPVLKALHDLGGSGTNSEIEEMMIQNMKLSNDEIEDIHRGNTTKLSYRCAWAKNYLKRYSLLENSSRGVWALSNLGKDVYDVDKELVKRTVKELLREDDQHVEEDIVDIDETTEVPDLSWEEEIISILKSIEPATFERLSQRLLRELGFVNVEVTGKSGDGGIDGKGVIKIGGVLSFHVVFQCKRYKDNVPPREIRDFRGAMQGRGDKGLFITTGSFSRDAKLEAKRDGAPPIDLIDGIEFANKLKDLRLGIDVDMVEEVDIKKEWFSTI
jgi:restriction system protein